jgi:general stress protein 26
MSIKKLAKLVYGIEIAILTTEGQGGCLYSRPMAVKSGKSHRPKDSSESEKIKIA